jgi:hypothetical protein
VKKAHSLLLVDILFLLLAACEARDPRIVLFQRFNVATTYEEARPLLSGVLARQLESLQGRPKEQTLRVLDSLRLTSYEPRIVEVNVNTSFLVLDNPKSNQGQKARQSYLLVRDDGKHWTLANRLEADLVMKSLWITEYSPSDFNQSSQCSVFGKAIDPSIDGKRWDMKSAVAIRYKDRIEISSYLFPQTKADLEYWKNWGMPMDSAVFDSSSLSKNPAVCRVVLGLDKNGQIESISVGFDDPALHYSALFQDHGWASPRASGSPTSPQSDLPPEFTKLEITKDRIKMETAGEIMSGGSGIRWTTKIDLPVWERGL